MQKHTLIRTIYLYLFSLVGLVLVIIAAVDFTDMGLKAFIFTQAEQEEYQYRMQPPQPYVLERVEKIAIDESSADLTTEDKQMLRNWLADYSTWKESQKNFDPIVAGRQRDAAHDIAMLLVGIPLYLYHWRVIKKDKAIG